MKSETERKTAEALRMAEQLERDLFAALERTCVFRDAAGEEKFSWDLALHAQLDLLHRCMTNLIAIDPNARARCEQLVGALAASIAPPAIH